MIYLNGILVVEGKEDISYLSNFIESEIVVTNGFEIDEDIISYLKNRHVIALLDPDEAGERIRKALNEKLNNVDNVVVDIKKCTRGIKNGIAECEIEEVLDKLKPFICDKPILKDEIKNSDLYHLGLYGNEKIRSYVCQKLQLGKCNCKTLYKRLILNNISLSKLCEIIEEYDHGN